MSISQCKHIRLRHNNDYSLDIETFVKSLEKQFNVDIRTLPQWKELIQNMYIVQTLYKQILQKASFRKADIIKKLYIQNTRASPFELSDKLIRTARKWHDMKIKRETRNLASNVIPDVFCHDDTPSNETVGDVSNSESTAIHPNTAMMPSQSDIMQLKAIEDNVEEKESIGFHLPVYTFTNQHKLLSTLESNVSQLSCKLFESVSESQKEDVKHLLLNSTNVVSHLPDKIIISKKTTGNNTVKICLTNITTEYLNVQYKNVTDAYHFTKVDVSPKIPRKLYPGLAAYFKVHFELANYDQDFSTSLCFRVRRNILSQVSQEYLSIPIITDFISKRCLIVPNSVSVPPVYLWQLSSKCGFPKALIDISVKDNFEYNVHVRKRTQNRIPNDNYTSNEMIESYAESLAQHTKNEENDTHLVAQEINEAETNHSVTNEEIVTSILYDLVNRALESFVFKETFLRVLPHSRKNTIVYFTKAEHIGFHQSIYDLEFHEPETDAIVSTKTIKVYAEVLPNPIEIYPNILDMTQSSVTHGHCKDIFTITNHNKIYTFDVKIKTTTKMDKIFTITPKETVIVAQSSTPFFVHYCSKSLKTRRYTDNNAYFVIKIVLKSSVPIFRDMPPIFYEIITPCIPEYLEVYKVTIGDD